MTEPPKRAPQVRVTQDPDAEPVRVVVTEDKDEPSIGLFALMIFLATLFGTLIGLGADFSELISSVEEIQGMLSPPPQLCIVGSDTILGSEGVGQDWEAEFEQLYDVRVRINATGSVGGVTVAAEGGCAHILAMSEPMTEDQYRTLTQANVGLQCAAEVGYDVISFITNINNPLVREVRDPEDASDTRPRVRPVEMRQIRAILTGSITDWSQTNNWPHEDNTNTHPITIWLRPDSGTSEVVLARLANFSPTSGQLFPSGVNYQMCESNLECLNRTLETPGSLYWVSVAWMRTQPSDYLSVISILDGDEISVNPLRESVDLEEYPHQLVRPLYLYVLTTNDEKTAELAEDFLRYVRGINGQQAIEARNFYTHFARPVDIEVEFPEPYFNIPGSGLRDICKPRS